MRATGWAIISGDGVRPSWGVLNDDPWGDEEGKHLDQFLNLVYGLIDRYRPNWIYYERIYLDRSSSEVGQLAKAQVGGLINMVAFQRKIELRIIATNTWRASFNGTARVPKEMQKAETAKRRAWHKQRAIEMCAHRGWLVDDHNAAEALAIAHCGLCQIDPVYRGRNGPITRRGELDLERRFGTLVGS